MKAKQLVAAKVDSDLEKDEIKAVVGLEADELASFKQKAKVERFKLFVNALVGTLSQTPQKKLDPTNYEDITRTLTGDQAYLLFVFDKLIIQVSVHFDLTIFARDPSHLPALIRLVTPTFFADSQKSPSAEDQRRVPEKLEFVFEVCQTTQQEPKRAPLPDPIPAQHAVSSTLGPTTLTNTLLITSGL